MTSFDEVRGKLLSLDEARERLSVTEPLSSIYFEEGVPVEWSFQPDWALLLDSMHGNEKVSATVSVDGQQFSVTKDAVLSAASAFGLPGAHARVLPPFLLNQEMNYWFSEGAADRKFNFLVTGGNTVSALVKHTKKPFSNLALLDRIEQAVTDRIGNVEMFVDFKFHHSLYKTDLREIGRAHV